MSPTSRGWKIIRSWFALTPGECIVLGGILLIFLIGLMARYLHLRGSKAELYEPAGLETGVRRP